MAKAKTEAAGGDAPKRERPNILLLETDDHLYTALGCMGVHPIQTPNIDRLAERGVLFHNNVCQGTACVPSRHSLLTGAYPHNNGLYTNRGQALDPRQWTFPSALQQTGYRTALIGKNHFRPRVPEDMLTDEAGKRVRLTYDHPAMIEGWRTYGFDDVRAVSGKVAATRGNVCPYTKHLESKGLLEAHVNDYEVNRDRKSGTYMTYTGASPLPEEDAHDAFIGKLAVDYIEGYRDRKPFFAWVDFVAPHPPTDAPEPYASMYDPADMKPPIPGSRETLPAFLHSKFERYEKIFTPETLARVRAAYFGMITLMDKWVGKIVAALEKRGMLDNTLIAFCGDQGSMVGDHGLWGKGLFYKGAINSPLVLSYPKEFRRNVVVDRPVEMQDLVPTFMDVAGVRPKNREEMGVSFMPLCTGEGQYAREAAFAETGRFKMIVDDEYKLIHSPIPEQTMLFDMRKDPQELNNLAGKSEFAAVEKEYRRRLLAWLSDTYAHANSWQPKRK